MEALSGTGAEPGAARGQRLNERSLPPLGVPTLTEVIEWSPVTAPAPPAPSLVGLESLPILSDALTIDLTPTTGAPPPAVASPTTLPLLSVDVPESVLRTRQIDEDILTQRVLEDLQRQVDLMLEYRLRAAVEPLVQQAIDVLRDSARAELASTLHEIVARAVSQELIRHRALAERGEGLA